MKKALTHCLRSRLPAAAAALSLCGCAVLQVDVAVYKGPLIQHGDIQAEQLVSTAHAAKGLLLQARNSLIEQHKNVTSSCMDELQRQRHLQPSALPVACPADVLGGKAGQINAVVGFFEDQRRNWVGQLSKELQDKAIAVDALEAQMFEAEDLGVLKKQRKEPAEDSKPWQRARRAQGLMRSGLETALLLWEDGIDASKHKTAAYREFQAARANALVRYLQPRTLFCMLDNADVAALSLPERELHNTLQQLSNQYPESKHAVSSGTSKSEAAWEGKHYRGARSTLAELFTRADRQAIELLGRLHQRALSAATPGCDAPEALLERSRYTGLARGPYIEQRSDNMGDLQALQQISTALLQSATSLDAGFSAGRTAEGIDHYTQEWALLRQRSTGDASSPARQALLLDKLLPLLVDLAGRMQFLALHQWILAPGAAAAPAHASPDGESADTPRTGGAYASNAPPVQAFDNFQALFEVVANSLLVQADDLLRQHDHKLRLKRLGNLPDPSHALRQQAERWLALHGLEQQLAGSASAQATALNEEIKKLKPLLANQAATRDDKVLELAKQWQDSLAAKTAERQTANAAVERLLAAWTPQPPDTDAQTKLDLRIAQLQQMLRESKASGNDGKALESALRQAWKDREDLPYLRPTSSFLRSVHTSTFGQAAASPNWSNLLLETWKRLMREPSAEDKIRSANDKAHWQTINSIHLSGAGSTNFAVAKDDVGNWYVKNMGTDPKAMIQAAKKLALYNIGGGIDTNLLRLNELNERIDQNLDKSSGSPDTDLHEQLTKERDKLQGGRSGPGTTARRDALGVFQNHYDSHTLQRLKSLHAQLDSGALISALKTRWEQSLKELDDAGRKAFNEAVAPQASDEKHKAALEAAATGLVAPAAPASAATATKPSVPAAKALLESLQALQAFRLQLLQLVDRQDLASTVRGDLNKASISRNLAKTGADDARASAEKALKAAQAAPGDKTKADEALKAAQDELVKREELNKAQAALVALQTVVDKAEAMKKQCAADVDAVFRKRIADLIEAQAKTVNELETATKVIAGRS